MELRLYFSCIELNLKVQEYIQTTRMFDSSQKKLMAVILRRLIQQRVWLNNYYFQHILFCVCNKTVSKIKAILLLVSQNKGPGV